MAIEGENLGVATVYLTVDKTSMDATIGKAKLELAGLGDAASKQYEAMSTGQRKMAESLVKQTEMIGKTRAEQIAYNAQLKIGGALGDEIAAKAVANAEKVTGAQQASVAATTAATDKFAVSAAERAAQEERYAAVMAAERAKAVEMEAARAAAAEARSRTVSEADAAEFAAFSTTVRAKQALMLQLNTAMASGLTTQREIAVAEDALDAAMAGHALTQKEQLTYITALDVAEARLAKLKIESAEATGVETASLTANTAAIKLNSRAYSELGTGLSEVLAGNPGRLRRTGSAFLNQSGFFQKMFTPAGLGITAGVAALGALTVAYVQAEKEANNFTRALYATGQQGITNAAQIEKMVATVGASTGSYGDAAKAMQLLVSSGKYASDQYEDLTRTLVNFASLTGGSLETGLQAIDSLNGQVGDGLVKLNSQYHFLTDTVYEQIAALQAQGKTEQARDLERKAFADGINQSTDDIKAHLDPLAKAWDAVGTAAVGAWRKMGQDVRANANAAITSIQTYFSDIGDLLDRIKHPIATVMYGGISPREVSRNQAAGSADANAQAEALNKQATQTLAEFGAEADKFKSAAEKRAAEIIRVTNQTNAAVAKAVAAGNKDLADKLRASGASLAEAIAAQGAEKPKTPHVKVAKDNTDKLRQGALDDIQKQIDAEGKLRDQQAQAKAMTAQFTATLAEQVAARKNAIDIQIASIGMGQKEADQLRQLNDLDQQRIRQVQQLERQQVTHPEQYAELQQRIDAVNASYKDMRDTMLDGFKRLDAAQANWVNGAIAAMQNWADQGADVADQVKGLFTDAFGQMNDALVNFVETGKLDFSSLADSIISDLTRIALKSAESSILNSILGMFAPTPIGGAGADWSTLANGIFGSANGNVFNSPSLSRYSGGVYDSPQFFKFASGGVFGEAGPEAIMPLSRGSDGKLGVKAAGAGAMAIEVNITNKGEPVQAKQTGMRQDGNKIILDMVLDAVSGDIAQGGKTAKAMQNRYGLARRGVPVGA